MCIRRNLLSMCRDITNRTTRRMESSGTNHGSMTPRTLTTTLRRSNVMETTSTTNPVTTTFTAPDTGINH
ncbi:hypothetical protein [Gimesia maris]|uniref:hypothetical protein n=1 Tax=Gimesia maris TaxID=122 RepID=UPI003A90DD62